MKLTKLFLTLVLAGIGFSSMAQVAIDPTGKRFMKQRERTKYGGPTHTTHKIPAGPDNINITFIEIQIDPAAKGGGIDITARGTKTPKVRGCDNCTVAGRVIVNGDAAKELGSVGSDEGTKAKQAKNAGASRTVSFKTSDNHEYTVVSNTEGGFMLSTIPNGTYTIWVGGKKVISDYILTSVEPTPEELKKEQEMIDKRKEAIQKQQQEEQPGGEQH